MGAGGERLRLVVLLSGSGSNLQAILDRCADHTLPAQVVAVISNRGDAYGLQRAAAAGVAQELLDHRAYPSREAYDQVLAERVAHYRPDLVVLAGFMRILSAAFVQRFAGRMLNIHPSLLPKFTGLHTHQRALDAGEQRHGASVHFVTEELDGGPVIVQAWVPVVAGEGADPLAARVLAREHLIYPAAIRWFAEGRLQLRAGVVYCNGEPLTTPLLLGPEDAVPFCGEFFGRCISLDCNFV